MKENRDNQNISGEVSENSTTATNNNIEPSGSRPSLYFAFLLQMLVINLYPSLIFHVYMLLRMKQMSMFRIDKLIKTR